MSRASIALVAIATLLSARGAAAQIPSREYVERRDSLLARVDSGSVIVVFGERAPLGFPSFHQNPNFRYLTGFNEPNAVLVLVKDGTRSRKLLFQQIRTPQQILMDGPPEAASAVAARTGLEVRPLAGFGPSVDSLLSTYRALYTVRDVRSYDFGVNDSLTRGHAFAAGVAARHPGVTIMDASPAVHALRSRKSAAELGLLRRAAEITSASLLDAWRELRAGLREYQVQARIEFGFRDRGADRPSFATNVSAGANAATAHHRADETELRAGDLVLMDVGASYQGYAADITRTVPVGGKFSPEQRQIYQIVRDAQAAAERIAGPGVPYQRLSDTARAVVAAGLARLGLIESATAGFDPPWSAQCDAGAVSCRQNFLFYYHGLSHGIGLEVHDPAQYMEGENVLRPGDAFTIEPGIYVDASRLDRLPDTPKNRAFIAAARAAARRYHGIGVRIEDDYLVTERGVERISTAPREVAEIERAIGAPTAARATGSARR